MIRLIQLFCFIIFCFILSGCTYPRYNTSEYKGVRLQVPFEKYKDAQIFIDGKEIINQGGEFFVERTFQKKEIILKKEGQETLKGTVKLIPTQEKWAQDMDGSEKSLLTVFIFQNSVGGILGGAGMAIMAPIGVPVMAFAGDPGSDSSDIVKLIKAPLGMVAYAAAAIVVPVYGVALDAYNVTVGVPSAIIINPWWTNNIEWDAYIPDKNQD